MNFKLDKFLQNPERPIKDGVEFVFKQDPELEKIGNQKQYSEYLDTIFPYSKIRNIVYHSSPNKIQKFNESFFGTYFSYSPILHAYGNIVISAIINIESPLIMPNPEDSAEVKGTYDKERRSYNNPSFSPQGERMYKYDSSIEPSIVTKEGVQIKVRNPEQIHVLGSEQDIEGFKKFIENIK